MDAGIRKYPMRRLNVNIERAITVLQIDLGRLEKHRANIEKYVARHNSRSLNDEQLNASRTVQQLTANVKQLEQLRLQVLEEDISEFDKKTQAVRDGAKATLSHFMPHLRTGGKATLCDVDDSPSSLTNSHKRGGPFELDDSDVCDVTEETADGASGLEQPQQLQPLQLDVEQDPETEHTWRELEHSVVELNYLMQDFSALVHAQHDKVDLIEDNVEQAAANVDNGASSLAKAARYKAALYPVAGAVVGTLIGGPVGFVAGLKIGAMAAVGGSVAGFAGGKLWQKKQTSQVDNDETTRQSRVTMDTHTPHGNHSTPDSTLLNTTQETSLTLSRDNTINISEYSADNMSNDKFELAGS